MEIAQVHHCTTCQTFLGWKIGFEQEDDAIHLFESQLGSYSNEQAPGSVITVFCQHCNQQNKIEA